MNKYQKEEGEKKKNTERTVKKNQESNTYIQNLYLIVSREWGFSSYKLK